MTDTVPSTDAVLQRLEVSAYRIPTDGPEADGTFAWDKTVLVLVEAKAGACTGLGYTYADVATALIRETLAGVILTMNAFSVPAAWAAMVRAVRNLGRQGIASMAIAAVDIALWDLKARLLDLPLVTLLGAAHRGARVYGSGGFTSYAVARLQKQLAGWAAQGIPRVKMKVGTQPKEDLRRVQAAGKPSDPKSNCSWTPTGHTAVSRRCYSRRTTPNWESNGLRSRFRQTILKG